MGRAIFPHQLVCTCSEYTEQRYSSKKKIFFFWYLLLYLSSLLRRMKLRLQILSTPLLLSGMVMHVFSHLFNLSIQASTTSVQIPLCQLGRFISWKSENSNCSEYSYLCLSTWMISWKSNYLSFGRQSA